MYWHLYRGTVKDNLHAILQSINPKSPIFPILYPEFYDIDQKPAHIMIRLNRWMRDVAFSFPNVHLVALVDLAKAPDVA